MKTHPALRTFPAIAAAPWNRIGAWLVACLRQHVERIMIVETGSGGGGNVLLAFILGAVLLAVGVVGFFMWDNYKSGGTHTPSAPIHITINKK
jgi:hypothetical protein